MNSNVITEECKKIKKTVELLTTQLTTKNPMDIAKHLGISISYLDDYSTIGFVFKGNNLSEPTIFINKNLDTYSQRIVCAHELGHLFTDDSDAPSLFDSGIDSISEFYANYFMKCLMPHVFSLALLDKYKTIQDFNSYVDSCIYFKKDHQ